MAEPPQKIEAAADRATEPDHGREYARHEDVRGDVVEAVREQQREIDESWAGPGLGPMTDGRWKGFLFGRLVGGALGLIILLPFGFLSWGGDLVVGGRVLIAGLAGALGGGTAGALCFGGRVPELCRVPEL